MRSKVLLDEHDATGGITRRQGSIAAPAEVRGTVGEDRAVGTSRTGFSLFAFDRVLRAPREIAEASYGESSQETSAAKADCRCRHNVTAEAQSTNIRASNAGFKFVRFNFMRTEKQTD